MEPQLFELILAAGDYALIGILLLAAIVLGVGILVASHIINPKRVGLVKNDTYESGMEPVGDTRRRFHVRFYLIAVLFLVFDVELLILYPWALLLPRVTAPDPGSNQAVSVQPLIDAGFGGGYLLAAVGVFFGLLLVGFIYEWRRGIFKWN